MIAATIAALIALIGAGALLWLAGCLAGCLAAAALSCRGGLTYVRIAAPPLWFDVAAIRRNPLRWFMNDLTANRAPPDYRPGWPRWWADFVYAYLRNPLGNFVAFVIGIADRPREVLGNAPMTLYARDVGARGLIHAQVARDTARFWWRGWVSYTGANFVIGLGAQNDGSWSVKVNGWPLAIVGLVYLALTLALFRALP